MANRPKKPLLPNRVLAIGEGLIPRDRLDELGDEAMQIFMREPDPNKWPPHMKPLIKYLPAEEQVHAAIVAILESQGGPFREALREWAVASWDALITSPDVGPENAAQIVDNMTEHVKGLIIEYLAQEQ
ncbi:MAG: hypothetical protein FJ118_11460 [Deltaproteobacteria bacterium]|nr:hypothetical protein [Deltaproteobacteria bacterium]